jgi:hypothetical protein
MQMGKLLDNLAEVYNSGVITISDTAESLDVAMETEDLEPGTATSEAAMSMETQEVEHAAATSEVAMSVSTTIVPATNDNNVSILKSMRAQFYAIYGEVQQSKRGGYNYHNQS